MNFISLGLILVSTIGMSHGLDPYLTQEVPLEGLQEIFLEMGDTDSIRHETFEDLAQEQLKKGNGYLIAVTVTPNKMYRMYDAQALNEWIFDGKLYGDKLVHNNDPINIPITDVTYYKLSDGQDKFIYAGNLSDLTSSHPSALKELLQKWYGQSGIITVTFSNTLKYPVILLISAKKRLGAPLLDTIIEPGSSYEATINLDDAGTFAYIGHLKNKARERIARKLQGSRFQKIGIPWAKKIVLEKLHYGQRITIN